MTAQFLVDPNEAEEAADFYLDKLGKEGVSAGGRDSQLRHLSRQQNLQILPA